MFDVKVEEGDDIVELFIKAYGEVADYCPQSEGHDKFQIFMEELRKKGFDCVIQRKDKNEDELCDCCSHKCRRCKNCNQEKTFIQCGNGDLICGDCGY